MRAVLALAPMMVVAFAGCTDLLAFDLDGSDLVVRVPPLSHGESWTQTSASSGSGEKLSYESTSASTARVLEGRHTRLDSYGFPVEVYVITGHYKSEGTSTYEGKTDSHEIERPVENTIEAGAGNILSHGTFEHTFEFGASSISTNCMATITDTVNSFAREPVRHDFASLRGETLTRDFSITKTLVSKDHFGASHRIETTYRVVGVETVTLRISGVEAAKQAFVVEVASKTTPVDPVPTPEATKPKREVTTRHYYVDGVGVPVKATSVSKGEKSTSEWASSVVDYTSGTSPLVFTGTMVARFEGVNPISKVAPLGRSPDLSGLDFGFSLSEAETAVLASNNGASYAAWKQANPDTIYSSGQFQRDPQRKIYSWSWWDTDGTETWFLHAKREIRAGVPTDSTMSTKTTSKFHLVDPSQAHRMQLVDARSAIEVAQKFMPEDKTWDGFSWLLHKWNQRPDIMTSYTVSAVEHSYAGGIGPVKTESKTVRSPQRSIDPLRGALGSGGGAGMGCGGGLYLDLPI